MDKKQLDNTNQVTDHTTNVNAKIPILLLCLGGVVIGVVLVKIMNIQIGTLLPYAVFLLCPLLHLVMTRGEHGRTMRDHGNHGNDHKSS